MGHSVFNLSRYSSATFISMAICAIVVYYVPYFWFGEASKILIHDNLDSVVTHVKILENNHAFFVSPYTIIKSVFNGVPLATIYPYYDLQLLIFALFGVFWGYVLNKLIASLLGFFGMYLLLKMHLLPDDNSRVTNIASSTLFALLPFWSFSSTVSALPLALYAFLNIRAGRKRASNWLIILLFSFASSLILSGAFFILAVAMLWLYDCVRQKQVSLLLPAALMLLIGGYIISHSPIIILVSQGIKTHRLEFSTPPLPFKEATKEFWNILAKGQYHAHSLHTGILVPILLTPLLAFFPARKTYVIIACFIVLTSALYGYKDYILIQPIFNAIQSKIPLQLDRFHFLHPMLWYVLLAISLSVLCTKFQWGNKLVVVIVVLQLGYLYLNHEIFVNRRLPSFKDFYSENTFKLVKSVIPDSISKYNVISVGMHPAIAQFNGFNTLDGYFPSYPLTHKHRFLNIISDELRRSPAQYNYFVNWGSRCYAYSYESHKLTDRRAMEIDSLKYNYDALIDMEGKYLLSTSRINQAINSSIELVDSVHARGDYWSIFVYRLK
jgi:hypothetical protein